MSKRTYRSISVNDVRVSALDVRRDETVVVAVDVAKSRFKAAIIQGPRLIQTVAWTAPLEAMRFVELISQLKDVAPVELVMESTGTYGDPVRDQMARLGVPVFRVSAKHTHDAAEIFDGVPSMHDAKAAQVLGWLHLQKRSKPWAIRGDDARDVVVAADTYELYSSQLVACLGRIEAKLARHFPELGDIVSLHNKSTLALLAKYGSPWWIGAFGADAMALMQDVGGPLLAKEKTAEVIKAARHTTGMRMTEGERESLCKLASEALRQHQLKDDARRVLEACVAKREEIRRVAEVIGMGTAAILWAESGDMSEYASAAAYVKALGLNLKERSSGKHQGQLKITKRGPSLARKYLYLAVLRLIQSEPHFKAWHQRKVEREAGQRKLKSIVALMRKLAAALWYVARGAAFDATKLFDSARLGLSA